MIPPSEWNPRKNGYDIDNLSITIHNPLCQVVTGNDGLYRARSLSSFNWIKRNKNKQIINSDQFGDFNIELVSMQGMTTHRLFERFQEVGNFVFAFLRTVSLEMECEIFPSPSDRICTSIARLINAIVWIKLLTKHDDNNNDIALVKVSRPFDSTSYKWKPSMWM